MNEKYILVIEKVSQILFEAIIIKEENLKDKIFEIDTDLLSLLRAIGWRVMSMLLTILISQVTTQAKKPGWKIQRRPHLKEHLYAGVEAMEFPEKLKHSIVDALVSLIEVGKVHKVIKKLQNYQGTGAKEIETLAKYLIRFRSLCSLSKIPEFRITNRLRRS